MKSPPIKNKVQSGRLSLRYPFKLLPSRASSYQLIGVFTTLPWCLSSQSLLFLSRPGSVKQIPPNWPISTAGTQTATENGQHRGISAQSSCISLLPRSISVGPGLLEPGDGSSLQGRSSCERVEIAPMSGSSNMESFWQGRSGPICLWGGNTHCPLFFSIRDHNAPSSTKGLYAYKWQAFVQCCVCVLSFQCSIVAVLVFVQ